MLQVETRNTLIHQARAILDRADQDGARAMTPAEIEQYDSLERQITAIDATIARMERLEASGARAVPATMAAAVLSVAGASARAGAEYLAAFSRFVRSGEVDPMLPRESRAMIEGTTTLGGFAVPETWEPNIVKVRGEFSLMRGLATVRPMGSNKINVPIISAFGAGGWVAEGGAFTDSDDTFAEVEITAAKGTRLVKVSEEMLNDAIFPVDQHLQESLGRSIGELEEAAFVAGDGSSKPFGVVVGSGLGVTAAGAAAITADEILDLYHSVGRPYRTGPKVGFMMADGTAKLLRKLKGSDGQYIWQQGLSGGEPDRLVGKPVWYSANMPAATTGLKSIVFGDMSYYAIYERPGVALQRLNELYAATGHVGFRGFVRVGGKLLTSAAVKHLIQA